MLWVQEKSATEEVRYHKVPGANNPADLMTKSLSRSVIGKHMSFVAQEVRSGRAEEALQRAGT